MTVDRDYYEQLVHHYFSMVNEENIDAVVDCFCPDAEIAIPLLDEPVKGEVQLREFFLSLVGGFQRHHDSVTSFVFEADRAASELEFDALTEAGEKIHLKNCNVYRFENGKIKRLRIYLDTVPLRQALGME